MRTGDLRVAILGATGLVGQEMIKLLERRRLPIAEVRLLGSERAEKRVMSFMGREVPVESASPERLQDVDVVLSSAGGDVSRALLPAAAGSGAVCIDNTSAFRMDPDVPLIVPEVNGKRLNGIHLGGRGAIVANPNCSTIQLVTALNPIHEAVGIRSLFVSTYQSVSGAGREAVRRFRAASRAILDSGHEATDSLETAAFDAIPNIGGLGAAAESGEERKLAIETAKILEAPIDVDACCVRIPVFVGHAESVLVETNEALSVASARELLSSASGVVLSESGTYPTPRDVAGNGEVHVGRVRASHTRKNGLLMWIVADNLLKGAAWNAVQIAERVIEQSHGAIRRSAATAAQV